MIEMLIFGILLLVIILRKIEILGINLRKLKTMCEHNFADFNLNLYKYRWPKQIKLIEPNELSSR